MTTRRDFLKTSAFGAAGLTIGGLGLTSKSYAQILGSNDKVRVGIVGFSDRCRSTLLPCFMAHAKELNFELVAVSDIWSIRRAEAEAHIQQKYGVKVKTYRNNEELYDSKTVDVVIISTADFQHALHAVEAINVGCDIYCEKPFAETMADNRLALETAKASNRVIQIGSQRRSGPNYQAASEYIRSGKFGKLNVVEMNWNVNQPGRWRRSALVEKCFEKDTDWKRYLLNRPYEAWDPRKYLEFRLFWPYSSGIPGQWMSHQIDTVNWFSGLPYPKSVAAGGGIYFWKDGRKNYDTLTSVFEYGDEFGSQAFQVVYHSRMHNSADDVKELYYSNGGTLNLDTNKVTPEGGLTENYAKEMGMEANLLQEFSLPTLKVSSDANTGADPLTSAHMRNWMECVLSRKKTNAPVEAGYNHSIATIMCNAAVRTGEKVVFDPVTQEVMAGGKVFQY